MEQHERDQHRAYQRHIAADPGRVLVRPFNPTSEQRAFKISARVMSLSEEEVHALLEQVLAEFGERHLKTREFLKQRYEQVRQYLLTDQKLSEDARCCSPLISRMSIR